MSYGSSAPAPDETMLQPPMPIIVGAPRWARFEAIAGEVLERCGYEVDGHGET